jgi:hypothetical protein
MRRSDYLGAGCLALLAACGTASGSPDRSLEKVPVLAFEQVFRPLDSVPLVPAADDPIAIPTSVLATPSGYVVADPLHGELKVFGRDGALVRTIGRPGDGPGEFRRPADLALDGNGRMVVLDMSRSLLSVRDTSGTLVEELVIPGSWLGLTAIEGTGHFMLTGLRSADPVTGTKREMRSLHEVDAAGRVTGSFHPFTWPKSRFETSFSNFFGTTAGDVLVTSSFNTNRVWFVDRVTGREWSAPVGGPWYRAPVWPKTLPAGKNGIEKVTNWAKQQMLLIKLIGMDRERLLAQFRTYNAEGNEEFNYTVVDTSGTSRLATTKTRLRILRVQGDTAYATHDSPNGDITLYRLLFSAGRAEQ